MGSSCMSDGRAWRKGWLGSFRLAGWPIRMSSLCVGLNDPDHAALDLEMPVRSVDCYDLRHDLKAALEGVGTSFSNPAQNAMQTPLQNRSQKQTSKAAHFYSTIRAA